MTASGASVSGKIEDLLVEQPHLGVLHLAVAHQELVVQKLGVVRSLVHIRSFRPRLRS